MCLFKSLSVRVLAWSRAWARQRDRKLVWHPFFLVFFFRARACNICVRLFEHVPETFELNVCLCITGFLSQRPSSLFDDKTRARMKLHISPLLHLACTLFFLSFILLSPSHPVISLSSMCSGRFTPPPILFFSLSFSEARLRSSRGSAEQATRTPLRRYIRDRLGNTLHFYAPLTI